MSSDTAARAIRLVAFVVFVASVAAATVVAGDWPQFLGPNRDGISGEQGLLPAWPKSGPRLQWKKQVGEGYSAPSIMGDRVVVFHRLDDREVVECWRRNDGKRLWQTSYQCPYEDGYGKGNGPRATPTIAGGKVITLGVTGILQCLDLADGKRVWQRDTSRDYRVPPNFFGVGTSPLIVDGLVLVNVGGREAGIVAFRLADGKEAWRATTDGASYSSPTLARFGNRRFAVFLTRRGVVILDPKTGRVAHSQRWRARYAASVNAATPLVIGDLLFFSASYETGALVLQAKDGAFRELWKGDEIMSNHYNTCIHDRGYLYGVHGRQEAGAMLRCIELKTGKIRWTKEGFGCASLLLADGKLIALTEDGDLVLIEPTPKEYREVSRAHVFDATPCRAALALSNGLLYGRDNRYLACWDLRRRRD